MSKGDNSRKRLSGFIQAGNISAIWYAFFTYHDSSLWSAKGVTWSPWTENSTLIGSLESSLELVDDENIYDLCRSIIGKSRLLHLLSKQIGHLVGIFINEPFPKRPESLHVFRQKMDSYRSDYGPLWLKDPEIERSLIAFWNTVERLRNIGDILLELLEPGFSSRVPRSKVVEYQPNSTKISDTIVRIVDATLESTHRTHWTYLGNDKLDTGCLEWQIPMLGVESKGHLIEDFWLMRVRQLLSDFPVIAYKSDHCLVVAPVTNQFEILRIEKTEAANYGMYTEDIIEELEVLDRKYGIDIVGASFDNVELLLKRKPEEPGVEALQNWLSRLCPDIYDLPTEFPDGIIYLWWD